MANMDQFREFTVKDANRRMSTTQTVRRNESVGSRCAEAPGGGARLATRAAAALLIASCLAAMAGCEVDSFFDPSKTGRFIHTPTTLPILERIDVIEAEDAAIGPITGVMPEDLLPSDLRYVLAPGDAITVELYELYIPRNWAVFPRRIDAAGRIRVPEIGEFTAAGRTVEELEQDIIDALRELVAEPQVNVHIDAPRAFTYTVYGFVANPGQYGIFRSDLRLLDALASIGGAPIATERVYVIRQVLLAEEVMPEYERDRRVPMPPPRLPSRQPETPVDIEDLIERLEERPPVRPGVMRAEGREPAKRRSDTATPGSAASPSRGDAFSPSLIDVDELEPIRLPDRPPVDVDQIRERRARQAAPPPGVAPGEEETWVYDEQRGEWVRVRRSRPVRPTGPPGAVDPALPLAGESPPLILDRIIEIDYQRLLRGDSTYNIVVRPNDLIFVDGPAPGVVYISGEIARPGVYQLPAGAGRLTLSRLFAAAGDPNAIAMPERVDLTRIVGPDREATIRVNLAAIRRRTEPDIYLKADDHIHVGTSWVATPLAVIRNGFRTTYGFGFLLDRNFGNDVFGVPPGFRGF
jgi:polysaccharide biosynthesis/export protein